MPLGEEITGMPQLVRELGQLLAGLRQRHAVADEDHRALGLQQHVERGGDLLGRGAAALGAERRRGAAAPRRRPPPGTR